MKDRSETSISFSLATLLLVCLLGGCAREKEAGESMARENERLRSLLTEAKAKAEKADRLHVKEIEEAGESMAQENKRLRSLLTEAKAKAEKDDRLHVKEISGQIFIVTMGRENVKLGLVAVYALSDQEIAAAAVRALVEGRAIYAGGQLADRLFSHLPPPPVKTDADGQFTLRVNGKVWLLARAERKVGSSNENYLWAVPTEGQTSKLLLSNDNLLDDPNDLRAVLQRLPGVSEVLDKILAEAKIKADAEEKERQRMLEEAKAKAPIAAQERLAWTGVAMRRAGFKEEQITRMLTQGGSVVAWGAGEIGRSGFPNHGQSIVPSDPSEVVAIAAGGRHTVALKRGGTVVAWGGNDDDQTTIPSGLNGVVDIAAAAEHTVALKSDGTVAAWGLNQNGQTDVPLGLNGVTAIAAGGSHTVALKSDGKVVAWGLNQNGQTDVPLGLNGVIAIAAGGSHTVALKSDGTVVAWGDNSSGQRTIPAGLSGVFAIAAGGRHTVALKRDGTVVAWGSNSFHQISVPSGLGGVGAIAAGSSHTVALKLP
jgi:hypothetical protein